MPAVPDRAGRRAERTQGEPASGAPGDTPASAAEVAAVLARARYTATAEADLQVGVAHALEAAHLPAAREVRLTGRDRIDFLVDAGIGVEVKVAGSAAAVLAQLARYAASPAVEALVLVTTRAAHATLPPVVGGKPLHLARIRGAG